MKIFYIILVSIISLTFIWSVIQYFYLKNIEKPNYIVLEEKKGYQIRQYDPYIIAYAKMEKGQDNNGFLEIAGYIFGDNTKEGKAEEVAMTSPVLVQNEEINMTSPVIYGEEGEGEIMSFVMPSKYKKITDLPTPNNEKVSLKEVPSQKWAVLKYSWSRSQKTREKKLKELINLLEKDEIEYTGEFQFAFYNPPTTLPFMLTNEVWVKLK